MLSKCMPQERTKLRLEPKDIDVELEYELQFWSRALRVSRGDLVAAVNAVGPSARAVSRELGRG
jgi:hypothetical protein